MLDLSAIIASAITGTVGIVGIGGTILSAKMTAKTQTASLLRSINAEDKRIKRAEKREIYSRCLNALDSLLEAAVSSQSFSELISEGVNVPKDIRTPFADSRLAALTALKSVDALILLAPDIYELAGQCYLAILDDKRERLDMEKIAESRDRVVVAMQADLT